MIPAAHARSAAAQAGIHFTEGLKDACRAAQAGADATASIAPRRGRSSYLGERALGHPDPGAHAVTLWQRALVEALATEADH